VRTARIASVEPDALALRMANHFGHKVPVSTDAGVTRIETRFGRIELEPAGNALVLRLDGEDGARLEEVALSHLARFARGAPVEPVWET
jgi:hypothetical protein